LSSTRSSTLRVFFISSSNSMSMDDPMAMISLLSIGQFQAKAS
jgi:hypothetical protein